jgi:hypothetical protein
MTEKITAAFYDNGGAYLHVQGPDYLASGLGLLNDTPMLQTAVTAANGLIPVFLGPGTYLCKNLLCPAGTVLIAANGTATLKLPALSALDASPICNVTGSSVTFRKIKFDGNKAAQPADGFADAYDTGANGTGRAFRAAIKMKDTGSLWSDLTVDRCSFVNTYGACVATLNIAKVRVLKCVADSCNFELAFLYANTAGASFFAGHQVRGNRATNVGSGHATVNSDGIVLTCAEDFDVSGNIVKTVERCGVKCEYPRRGAIRGNVVDTNTVLTFEAIQLQSTSLSTRVSGNTVRNTGLGITVNPQAGQSSTGCSINNNTIEGTTAAANADGISVGNGSIVNLQIHNNNLTAIKRNCIGIQPNGTVRSLSIKGNQGTTTGTTSGGGLLLNVTGGNWRGVTVSGNHFDCGNVALAGAGIYLTSGDSSTIALLKMTDNIVDVGTGHNGIRENVAVVSSGKCDGNVVDGAIALLSAGFRCGDGNVVVAGSGNTVGAPGLSRTATTTPVAVTADDHTVYSTMAVASAVAVNLPQFPQIGSRITIKDGKGDAATNNITINAFSGHSIDTTATYTIKNNYGAVTLEAISSTAWRVVSRTFGAAAAIGSPTAPSASYVQSEAQDMKNKLDSVRLVLIGAGLTS